MYIQKGVVYCIQKLSYVPIQSIRTPVKTKAKEGKGSFTEKAGVRLSGVKVLKTLSSIVKEPNYDFFVMEP